MDPITQGHLIFADVVDNLPSGEIRNLEQAAAILEELIVKTDGLVIVDFLDSSSWDNLHSCEYDAESGRLSLYWRDYRTDDKATLEKNEVVYRPMFGASSYSLTMAISVSEDRAHFALPFVATAWLCRYREEDQRNNDGRRRRD